MELSHGPKSQNSGEFQWESAVECTNYADKGTVCKQVIISIKMAKAVNKRKALV